MDQVRVLDYPDLKAEDLLYWQKRAFREWALRPGPMWTFLKSLNSWQGLKSGIDKYWSRSLRALGIRARRFYCTRHAYISWALAQGVNVQRIAQDCGTSLEMIHRHYGRWIPTDSDTNFDRLAVAEKAAQPRQKVALGAAKPVTIGRRSLVGAFEKTNGPNGNRTRVTDVRGRCPRPLDDGTVLDRPSPAHKRAMSRVALARLTFASLGKPVRRPLSLS
jgi:hypothetical protein